MNQVNILIPLGFLSCDLTSYFTIFSTKIGNASKFAVLLLVRVLLSPIQLVLCTNLLINRTQKHLPVKTFCNCRIQIITHLSYHEMPRFCSQIPGVFYILYLHQPVHSDTQAPYVQFTCMRHFSSPTQFAIENLSVFSGIITLQVSCIPSLLFASLFSYFFD